MNLAAIIAWYDEHPDDLHRTVRSLEGFCDMVIALDGPYALFPSAADHPRSPREQLEAIEAAAHAADIDCHTEQPAEPWHDNEVGKRARLFDLARECEPDWVLRIDADESITTIDPAPARALLEQTHRDVAEVTVTGIHPSGIERRAGNTYTGPHRMIFRLLPALTCLDVHWRYTDLHTGRDLWGPQSDNTPALDLTQHITITHHHRTDPQRTQRAWDYYEQRANHRIEGVI